MQITLIKKRFRIFCSTNNQQSTLEHWPKFTKAHSCLSTWLWKVPGSRLKFTSWLDGCWEQTLDKILKVHRQCQGQELHSAETNVKVTRLKKKIEICHHSKRSQSWTQFQLISHLAHLKNLVQKTILCVY